MKKQFVIMMIIALSIPVTSYCMGKLPTELPMKKKILILTSFGGGGNFVASKAIEEYLQADYEIQLCHAFKEILAPLDPFNSSLFNSSGEEFYNSLVPGKHFHLLGWIYQFGTWYMQSQKEKINLLLRDYFAKTKPDLIISVIPVINNIILGAAQELSIPFLLIPTDLDVTPYIINLKNPTYKKFHLGLIFNDKEIIAPITTAQIPAEQLHILGAPLRTAFFNIKDKDLLKKKLGIAPNKTAITLLMGSLGSDEIEKYAAELIKVSEPLHLFVCIGKNKRCLENLEKLKIPPHISFSIIGFTPNIADYMMACDLLITKSGTLSVCEAIYLNLPLLLDATSTLLPWEKYNHHFVKKNELGLSLYQFNEIAELINTLARNGNQLDHYRKNLRHLEKKNCQTEMKELVKKILQ